MPRARSTTRESCSLSQHTSDWGEMTGNRSRRSGHGLREAATAILAANDHGTHVVPGPGQYPAQWNWDSALIAVGLAHIDPARARLEVEQLLSGRWDDGLLPHIVFRPSDVDYFPGPSVWQSQGMAGAPIVAVSGITQPPVLATAIRVLHECHPDIGFLERSVPSLDRWHRWLHDNRSRSNPLVAIVHPWESGTDNSPRFDKPLSLVSAVDVGRFQRRDLEHVPAEQRPGDEEYGRYASLVEQLRDRSYRPTSDEPLEFIYIDVAFNSILAVAEDDLAWLRQQIGLPAQEARERAAALRQGIAETWDDELGGFLDFDLRQGMPVIESLECVTSLLPMYAGVADQNQLGKLIDTLWDPTGFGPSPEFPVGITSVVKRSDRFDPRCYWRGPVWVNMNWLLVQALRRHGRQEEASRLRDRTLDLVQEHGFYEYYDPRTGEGIGCSRFSWSASLTLDLLERP